MTTAVNDPSQLKKILIECKQKRASLLTRTNAFRLINTKGDGLDGLVIDIYNRHINVQIYSSGWFDKIVTIKNSLVDLFTPDYLVVKDRTSSDGRSLDQPQINELIKKTDSKTVITENGLQFAVDLNDTVNTGLFLDMRENRRMIGRLSKDKSVLNCFSYTCSFGVYAKAKGASKVTNVDISAKALTKGKENYALNNLKDSDADFVRANCVEYLERAVKKNNQFDVVIIDPPSFARDKSKVFSVKKEFPRLIDDGMRITKSGGYLFLSTNFSEIDSKWLKQTVTKFSVAQKRKIKNLKALGQDIDFTGSGLAKESYLAALLVEF